MKFSTCCELGSGKHCRCAHACMQVKEVVPGAVMVAEKKKDDLKKVDFGTCVWTTGIKMAPITSQLINQLPSGHTRTCFCTRACISCHACITHALISGLGPVHAALLRLRAVTSLLSIPCDMACTHYLSARLILMQKTVKHHGNGQDWNPWG